MDHTPSGPSPSGICIMLRYTNTCTFITFQIKKDVIKNYQIGRTIPHCGFQLELVSDKSPQVQRLCHKVVIKGVPSPNSFHIRYPQPEAGNYQP